MTATPPRTGGNAGGQFFGVMLMAVGGLIFALCGLCSVGFLVLMIAESRNGGDIAGTAVTVGLIGGIPMAVGAGLFLVGLNLFRASRPKPDPNVFS